MILLICGIKTNDTNEHINRLTENKLMVIRKEGWWGGRHWEFGIDMYTMLYLKCLSMKRI